MAQIEVPHPGAAEIVARLLSEALSEHPDVQWLGLVSEDGFAIASEGVAHVNDDAVAAGAVRMMIQVRAMAKALNQVGTSQIFMEGSQSGICVIDKDPWVLVMVGAPGVPIGLLRYEAREIAEAFPVNRRAELPSEPIVADVLDEEQPVWWSSTVIPETEDDLPAYAQPETEIRWDDEPTTDDASGVGDVAEATDFVVVEPDEVFTLADDSAGVDDEAVVPVLEVVEEEVVTFDLADADEPVTFDLVGADEPVSFELSTPDEPVAFDLSPAESVSFDLEAPAAEETVSFDLAAPAPDEQEPVIAPGLGIEDDLMDLAPPAGPSIDLPPPTGPAFQLPPPV